ncbi:MAG: septum formation initiator family protein [bacterium]|nr:septum formation initiator family protein [bacterium]
MKEVRRGLLHLFFGLELFGFVFVYFFGAQGIQVLIQLRQENKKLDTDIGQLNLSIARLKNEVVAWQEDPFCQEKFAREQLQMARSGDEIYYLT